LLITFSLLLKYFSINKKASPLDNLSLNLILSGKYLCEIAVTIIIDFALLSSGKDIFSISPLNGDASIIKYSAS